MSAPRDMGRLECGVIWLWDRLNRAILKDRAAALQSASWGLGQIMGVNFVKAGFEDVEDMVAAMSDSEDRQLMAMANFLTGTKLASFLRGHDWASFARGYNGSNFAINRYDVRLNSEYQRFSAGVLPDLNVRAVQLFDISRIPPGSDRWHSRRAYAGSTS
jgi:N-acetylmuramidase